MHSISVIIPAYNAGHQITDCLTALRRSTLAPLEIIVVDDTSSDDTRERAAAIATKVIRTGGRRGPGFARNLGFKESTGDIVFFLDSDVRVRKNTVERMACSFADDPTLDAVIGSYDRTPGCWDFLSQYRNLMHTFVHQHGSRRASTFWSGCGAVRREVFVEYNGFDESRSRPAIEDIELGYRMSLDGRNILLDRYLQVTHLKRWSFWSIVKTDIFDRGIPWTELILSSRFMPNDLNLRFSQRISVVLAFLLVAVTGTLTAQNGAHMIIPMLSIALLMLGGWWTEIRHLVRPRVALMLLSCFVAVLTEQAYSQHMFPLVAALLLSPVFFLLMRPSYQRETTPTWSYLLSALYIVASLCAAAFSLPIRPLLFLWIALIAALCLLNARFYFFLKQERRIVFMMAAIPLHFLHHFYNGISFCIGLSRHIWGLVLRPSPASRTPTLVLSGTNQQRTDESSLLVSTLVASDVPGDEEL